MEANPTPPTLPDNQTQSTPQTSALVENPKLQAAIQRVMERAGNTASTNARYDRQHHRHNKS
jgi:hypothetical protein